MGRSGVKYVPLDFAAQPCLSRNDFCTSSTSTLPDKGVRIDDQKSASTAESSSQSSHTISISHHILDPYAQPYVPHALKYVNGLHSEAVWHTPPLRDFDYTTYISAHAASAFLPAIPAPSIISIPQGFTLNDESVHVLVSTLITCL